MDRVHGIVETIILGIYIYFFFLPSFVYHIAAVQTHALVIIMHIVISSYMDITHPYVLSSLYIICIYDYYVFSFIFLR